MKKIVILTSTRAEYGLLRLVILKFLKFNDLDVRVAVTGSHLSPEFGMTIKEILADGITIDKKIEILLSADTPSALSKAMGLALIGFSDYFSETNPDALIVLGDRFETLAVCMAAVNSRIPIIHINGGEATEGLIDEAIRNAITKMSYLHFASTETYKNRIIQMGENPERVFAIGALGVENVKKMVLLTKSELEKSLGISLGERYAVLTFHPVTLENHTAEQQIENLISALEVFPEISVICTKANMDTDGRVINDKLNIYAKKRKNIYLFDSLGVTNYLSAIRAAEFVIGNSSSGIIEVPSFGVPTVNIGNRQKGRIQANSIVNCLPQKEDIVKAIYKAISNEFKMNAKNTKNPYEGKETSDMITNITYRWLTEEKLSAIKPFYDIADKEV